MLDIIINRRKEYEEVAWYRNDRLLKAEPSTISDVIVEKDGKAIYNCFCLENGGPSTDTPKQDKRIVARIYKLYETESTVSLPKEFTKKNGIKRCISLYTEKLPKFKDRRIHIHIGNAPQDTEGCLLFGLVDNKNGTIGQSTQAIKDIYFLCFKEGLENCRVIINEIAG